MSERDRMRRGSGEPRGMDGAEPPPEVKRPRGSAWRRLEAEGVVWEGQVVLVGEESDLAARLVVTKHRIAFVRGGAVVLEIGREWLKPPPLMLPDGTIALSVTIEGAGPEDLFVQTREGRRVAGHLVTLLGGSGVRRVGPPEPTRPARAPTSSSPARPPAGLTSPPPLPGPLFPDETGPLVRRPAPSARTGGLPVRPDPSPPQFPEPSWARSRRERAEASEKERSRRANEPGFAPSTARAEPPERVAALIPAASPFDPPRATQDAWSTFDKFSRPATHAEQAPEHDALLEILPAPAPPAGVGRNHDWNLQPIRGMAPRAARRRRRQEWLARLFGLLVLVIFTSVAVTSRAPVGLPGSSDSRLAAPTLDPNRPAVARAQPTATASATVEPPAPGTTVVDLAQQTAEAIGVGGPESSATVSPTSAPPPAPTHGAPIVPNPWGGAGWFAAAGSQGADETAPAPATATVTSTHLAIATATGTAVVPTELPTLEPAATGAPTPEPTATIVPTEVSTAPGEAADPIVASGAPASGVPAQAPSLAVGEVPAQVFANGPFRFAIAGAVRAPSVPALGLHDYGTGEWVALFVDVVNWSDAPATLRMPEFTLADASRTAPVLLDTGTGLVARSFGLKPAYVHDAQIPYAAGEQHRILLLFLVHPEATDLTLRVGEAAVKLEDVLAETFDPADLPAEEPIVPDLLEATVTAVLDAETIEVEIAGVRQEIRYLGIDAPDGDACWAAEATQANAALVAGQTVWLERQRSNADRQGRLMRDVWVRGPDGTLELVAARLVALGAAEPTPIVPNTRLSGWLTGVAAEAQAAAAGRWAVCPAAGVELGLGQGLAIVLPFLLGLVWLALGTPGIDVLTARRHGARLDDAPADGSTQDRRPQG